MYYTMYLTSLCSRRNWAQPTFEWRQTRNGYTCLARVNNREYCTESEYPSPELARDAAACQAYMLCRNFSANDGMYPGQQQKRGGIVQGLPVAIGAGRQSGNSNQTSNYANLPSDQASNSGDSDRDRDRRSSSGSYGPPCVCPCGQLAYARYERCADCISYESGY